MVEATRIVLRIGDGLVETRTGCESSQLRFKFSKYTSYRNKPNSSSSSTQSNLFPAPQRGEKKETHGRHSSLSATSPGLSRGLSSVC